MLLKILTKGILLNYHISGEPTRDNFPEFPDFLVKVLVHGQNLDICEFGKGALSELRFCGVAVLRSERGKAEG